MEIRQGYKQTEVGIIPEEWEVKKIKDILEIGSGKDYKKLSSGDIPVFGTGGYMLSVDDFLYDGESVFIGRKGTINNPFYYKGKFWTIDTLFYTYNFRNVFPKWVLYKFDTINWLKYNEASGVPSLSKQTIYNIDIAIPPLKEQEKIAEILSNYDKAIEQQELLIEKEKEFKKGMMQKIFSQKIRFKDDNGEDYPEWHLVYTKDISKITMGFTPSTKDEEMWNGQYKWLSITDLKENGKYIYKTSKTISEKGIKNKRILLKGTLVMSFKLTLGRVGILADNMFTNEAICHFHWLDKDKISTEYIYYYLSNIDITNFGKQAVKGVTLNTESLNSIEIQLPCFEEQEKIANFLSDIDSKIELLENKLELLKNEKKGMMQKLLTGEVRV